jgi:hypothetical protein
LVLSGIVRYCQVLSGIVRYCQVSSGIVRYRQVLAGIGRYHVGSKKHLDDLVPNDDFPAFYFLGIPSLVSGSISYYRGKYYQKTQPGATRLSANKSDYKVKALK